MPEVKVVLWESKPKRKTIHRVKFMSEKFIEEKFGSTQAFLREFGERRKISVKGETKFAVICEIYEKTVLEVKKILTEPIDKPPFRVPENFWEQQRPRLRRSNCSTLAEDACSTYKPEQTRKKIPTITIDAPVIMID